MQIRFFHSFALLAAAMAITFASSQAFSQSEDVKIETGQRIQVKDPDGKMIRGTVKRINKVNGQAEVEIFWKGKRRKAWTKFTELYDTDGWPIAVDPFKVGATVEVLEKGEWVPATVEEIRGQKIKVRLEESKMVRIVTEKGIRDAKQAKPGGTGAAGDQPAGDANALFDPATGEWRVGNLKHPKELAELRLGMDVYVLDDGVWKQGKIDSLSTTRCTVKGEVNGRSFSASVHPMETSLTEPNTVMSAVTFADAPPKKIIDAAGASDAGAIPPVALVGGGDAFVKTPIDAGAHPVEKHSFLRDRVIVSPWHPKHVLVASDTDNSFWKLKKGGRLAVIDRQTGRATFKCGIPSGWTPVSINASGTHIAMTGKNDANANRLVIVNATNPTQPTLSGLIFTDKPDRHGARSKQSVATYISDHLLLVPDAKKSAISLFDTQTNTRQWLIKGVTQIAIRPDGKLMAARTKEGIAFVELPSGKILRKDDRSNAALVCFSEDGKHLGLSYRTKLELYDPIAKNVTKTLELSYGVITNITNIIDDYLIVSDGQVYSVEHKVPVWKYTSRNNNFAYTEGRGVTAIRDGTQLYLVPLTLDTSKYDAVINDPAVLDEAVLVSAGTRVRLSLRAGGSDARKRAEDQMAERGWVVDPTADITLTMKTERGKSETVKYRGSFGAKDETVTVRKSTAHITIQKDGDKQAAWQIVRSSGGPGSFVHLREGETVQQRANKAADSHLGLFTSFELPHRVMKLAYRHGLRTQAVSSKGLSAPIDPGANAAQRP